MRIHLRRATAIVMACALLLAPLAASARSSTSLSVPTATAAVVTAPTSTTTPAAAELQGTGAWQKLACLGCVGGFLLLSAGGSIAGVMLAISMYPEAAVLCAAGCYAAFAL